MEHPIVFKISTDGGVTEVYHPNDQKAPPPVTLGRITEEERGGYVLPESKVRRAAFNLLRRAFGNNSPIAAWTRTWRGPWVVISAADGHQLPGTFATHALAVQAEVQWLLQTK